MNLFQTVMAWAQALATSPALKGVAAFITNLLHDEVPVAEALIAKVAGSLPADIAASKPLVAFATVAAAAAAEAEKSSIAVGVNAVSVAASNYVNNLLSTQQPSAADAGAAIATAAAQRDAAIAAANAAFAKTQQQLDAAAAVAAGQIKAAVTS